MRDGKLDKLESGLSDKKQNDASSTYSAEVESTDVNTGKAKASRFSQFIDSFKPLNLEDEGIDTSQMSPVEITVMKSSRHPLARNLRARHLQMIAIGGTIGTGLFIGFGYALAQGGPASVLIGYLLIGFALLSVVNGLGELSVQFPISGSFNAFFSRFIDPSWGFTIGILYACSWLVSLPSELIACAMTIGYWNADINPTVWVAIFYVVVVSINLFGVKGFGEAEFVFSLIKVLAVLGFVILGICIICGVGKQGYIGGRYWHHPGAFNHGFKGVCSVFVSAAFSFGGVELVALAAAETKNPRKALPRATKQVFWRIMIFYISTAIVIGLLVPYTNEQLLNGSSSEDINASPFVIALKYSGIKVVPHIMNAVILIAVLSVGNSSVYGASRTLSSLAAQGLLPRCLAFIDKGGRPMVAIMLCNVIGLLGFLVASNAEGDVFTWFFSVCSLAAFFTWIAICITHIRWRLALKAQGRSLDEVIFLSPSGLWGSIVALVLLICAVIGEVWVSIWPVGSSSADVVTFWENCLSLPLALVLWAGYKTYVKSWNMLYIKLDKVDLDTGRREVDMDLLIQNIQQEKEKIKQSPLYYRFYRFWC